MHVHKPLYAEIPFNALSSLAIFQYSEKYFCVLMSNSSLSFIAFVKNYQEGRLSLIQLSGDLP